MVCAQLAASRMAGGAEGLVEKLLHAVHEHELDVIEITRIVADCDAVLQKLEERQAARREDEAVQDAVGTPSAGPGRVVYSGKVSLTQLIEAAGDVEEKEEKDEEDTLDASMHANVAPAEVEVPSPIQSVAPAQNGGSASTEAAASNLRRRTSGDMPSRPTPSESFKNRDKAEDTKTLGVEELASKRFLAYKRRKSQEEETKRKSSPTSRDEQKMSEVDQHGPSHRSVVKELQAALNDREKQRLDAVAAADNVVVPNAWTTSVYAGVMNELAHKSRKPPPLPPGPNNAKLQREHDVVMRAIREQEVTLRDTKGEVEKAVLGDIEHQRLDTAAAAENTPHPDARMTSAYTRVMGELSNKPRKPPPLPPGPNNIDFQHKHDLVMRGILEQGANLRDVTGDIEKDEQRKKLASLRRILRWLPPGDSYTARLK